MNSPIEISPETIDNKPLAKKNGRKRLSPTRKNTFYLVAFVIMIMMSVGSIFLLKNGIRVGATAMKDNFHASFSSERDNAYQKLYQSAFDRAEKKYHVSNKIMISIGNLEEAQNLEVLKASDVEFIIEERDNNTGNVTSWLEVEGEGTFIVDLHAAEFIIDNDHQYVLIRVPNPQLTNITITNTNKCLFIDDIANGSYSEGVDLAIKQRNEASLQIQKSLLSNTYIFNSAKDVATSMIQNLVKQFNSDIPTLNVEVEFME